MLGQWKLTVYLFGQVDGISLPILAEALAQAKAARAHVLQEMAKCSPGPRKALGPHAPHIQRVRIDTSQVAPHTSQLRLRLCSIKYGIKYVNLRHRPLHCRLGRLLALEAKQSAAFAKSLGAAACKYVQFGTQGP